MAMIGLTGSPRNIVVGRRPARGAVRYAYSLGLEVLVRRDEFLLGDVQFMAMMDDLAADGVTARVYSSIAPELAISSIADGVAAGWKAGAEIVIGIGGG